MKRNQFVNARGQVIDTDDDVCPPGFGLRTSMMLMDGLDSLGQSVARHYARPAQITDGRTHQPGFRLATSTMRDAASDRSEGARAARKKILSDAWREQSGAWLPTETPDLKPFKPTPDADAAGILSAAYLAEKQRVSNAWRSPAGMSNPAATKARVFEKNWTASFAPYEADAADAADAAHAEMTRRVCDAWRQGA